MPHHIFITEVYRDFLPWFVSLHLCELRDTHTHTQVCASDVSAVTHTFTPSSRVTECSPISHLKLNAQHNTEESESFASAWLTQSRNAC